MSGNVRKFTYMGQDCITLPADRSAFEALRSWISGIAGELKLPDRTRKQLLIVADEIFTNITTYGYPSGSGEVNVTVEFDIDLDQLDITFVDSGVPYNPLACADPDVTCPLAERQPGGLGIFIVKKLMDTVEYRRENNCNILTARKNITR